MTRSTFIQKRLIKEYRSRKHPTTWRAIAACYGVNVRYVYDLAVNGIEPKNYVVRRALGLSRLKLPNPNNITPAWVIQAADYLQHLEEAQNARNNSLPSNR
jgi:hypothetical protein